jgi:hypothetical protein
MAKEPKSPDAGDTAETVSPAMQQLAVENASLKQQIEALRGVIRGLEAQLKLTGITDDIREEVTAKMRAGLSQQDAIDVVRRQRAHDAQLKAQQEAGKSPVPA